MAERIADDIEAIIEARRALFRERMNAIGYCQKRDTGDSKDCWCWKGGIGGSTAPCPPDPNANAKPAPEPAFFRMPDNTPVPWFPR